MNYPDEFYGTDIDHARPPHVPFRYRLARTGAAAFDFVTFPFQAFLYLGAPIH